MADPNTSGAPARAPEPSAAEDPLAADRRTLVIGGSAMVALILVGVVSAQLFARGGCTSVISPEPAEAVSAGAAPADVVDEVLGPVDGGRAIDIVERAAGAPVEVAIPVGEASAVAPLDGGLITTGTTVTSFDADLTPVATFTTDDHVVGDGSTVYDVTVPNEATGQTDAFVPLQGVDLAVGTCVDTAVVGAPFAFLLGADDGQLLLFRADEEGEEPALQLRDAQRGAIWDAPLTLPGGPPGALAERLTAALGPDAVVAARRVGPQEEDDAPALVAVEREDGSPRFEVPHAELARAADLDPDDPIRWEVAAVGRTSVLVHGRSDPLDAAATDADSGAGASDGSLLVLDLADGQVLDRVTGSVGPLETAAADLTDAAGPDRYAVATAGTDGGASVITVVDADGATTSLGPLVHEAAFAWADGAVLVAARDSLSRLSPDDANPTAVALVGGRFPDVTITDDGRVAALVTDRDGTEAVLLVTAPTDALASSG